MMRYDRIELLKAYLKYPKVIKTNSSYWFENLTFEEVLQATRYISSLSEDEFNQLADKLNLVKVEGMWFEVVKSTD